MNDQKSPLVIGLLIVGIFLVAISLYFSLKSPVGPDQNSRLARVERETGTVHIIRNGFTQKEKLSEKASLFHLDSVETNDTGEATLSFESAYRVKVFESSLVTLEKNKSITTLIIKKGEVQIDSHGREGELYISKNGERTLAGDYNGSQLNTAIVTTPVNGETVPHTPGGLTEEEITAVMVAQSGYFKKCFTQLLQKDQKSKGEVTLSFTIENSGKLSVVEATSATLFQEDFRKCLLEVMNRVSFKAFSGPPISTLFPLKFD